MLLAIAALGKVRGDELNPTVPLPPDSLVQECRTVDLRREQDVLIECRVTFLGAKLCG